MGGGGAKGEGGGASFVYLLTERPNDSVQVETYSSSNVKQRFTTACRWKHTQVQMLSNVLQQRAGGNILKFKS